MHKNMINNLKFESLYSLQKMNESKNECDSRLEELCTDTELFEIQCA